MALSVVWLDAAKDDLRAFFDYLHPLNPVACRAYIAELERTAANLAEFPEQGRRYDDRYRVIVTRNHLIFYRHDAASQTVSIVRVIDGRRDLPNILGTD